MQWTSLLAHRGRTLLAVLSAVLAVLAVAAANAHATQRIFRDGFDEKVNVITPPDSKGRVIVGGAFTSFGQWVTGPGAVLGPDALPNTAFPRIGGTNQVKYISAVLDDGAGGFFIGGAFGCIGGDAAADGDCTDAGEYPRSGLARLRADGSVDPWDPQLSGTAGSHTTEVTALAKVGDTLYVAGAFDCVNGPFENGACSDSAVARQRLAAVSVTTGVATAWDPHPNRTVNALAVAGNTVYAGGAFTCVNGDAVCTDGGTGTERKRVAAFDATTGAVVAGWNPAPTSTVDPDWFEVSALAVSGDTVFVGGDFTDIGGKSRRAVAALDGTTGLATTWNPSPLAGGTTSVKAITVAGGTVYVGGYFQSIAGEGRNSIASFDDTGSLTRWNPGVGGVIRAIAKSGDTVYLGGQIGADGALAVAADTGTVRDWRPGPRPQWRAFANAVAVNESGVFVGGNMSGFDGDSRERVAQLGPDGRLTNWRPGFNRDVKAALVVGDTAYLGGEFGLTAINTNHGFGVGFDPPITLGTATVPGTVNAIARLGDTVYVAGAFTCVGGDGDCGASGTGMSRNGLAAFSAADGSVTAWNPNASPAIVLALTIRGGVVYAGGTFTCVNGDADCTTNGTGVPRNYAAAFDATSAVATAWNPNPSGNVMGLTAAGDTVYAGGNFSQIGGETRGGFAALDATTGAATQWDARVNGTVSSIAVDGDTVYAGGTFSCVNGQCAQGGVARTSVAAFDAGTAVARPWNADIQVPPGSRQVFVNSVAVGTGTVFVGGDFLSTGTSSTYRFVSLTGSTGAISWTWPGPFAAPPANPSAIPGHRVATVSWSPVAKATKYIVTADPGAATCTTTTTSCDVTGLANGTAYTFTVVADNGYYTSAPSAQATATPIGPPEPPTAVTATPSKGKLLVEWVPPDDNGGVAIGSYTATSSGNAGTCTATAPDTTCTIDGLTNGTARTITVTATNAEGTSAPSEPSTSATPVGVPDPPTGVTATPSKGKLLIEWVAPDDDGGLAISAYTATASGNAGSCEATGPATRCTIEGLANGTARTVTVTATNTEGESSASEPSASSTPIGVPDPPTGVTATPSRGEVRVEWVAPDDNGGVAIDSYTATASGGAGNCTAAAPDTTCTIDGLTNGTARTVTVTATNAEGTSAPSEPSTSATPVGIPDPPTGVTATPRKGKLIIEWAAPDDDGGLAISSYTATASGNAGSCEAAGPATRCTIEGLANGTPRTATVTATNSEGTSPASLASASAIPVGVPDPPTAVTVAAGDRTLRVQWTPPADAGGLPITSYTATASGGTATCTVAVPTTACTITGLAYGTAYTATVTARNSEGPSVGSLPSESARTADAPVVPAPPAPAAAPAPRELALRGAPSPAWAGSRKGAPQALVTTVSAPGPGAVSQSGIAGSAATARDTARARFVGQACAGSAKAKAAGAVTVRCALSASARRVLASGPLALKVVTTFTGRDGTSARSERVVTLKGVRPRR